MTTSSLQHRILASLSVCGFVASIIAYIYSFLGTSIDAAVRYEVLLGIGVAVLLTVMNVIAYRETGATIGIWTKPLGGMSRWVVLFARLLTLVAIAHLGWFFFQHGGGAPAIMDGQYVVSSRGHVLKVLSRAEYLASQRSELRVFASFTLALYFVPMMYWSFPKAKYGLGLLRTQV